MQPEMETQATQAKHGWRDQDGFIGPAKPGNGPRSDPRGAFPTGPEIGDVMPNVRCNTADQALFNLYQNRGQRPAIFIFYRSAVW